MGDIIDPQCSSKFLCGRVYSFLSVARSIIAYSLLYYGDYNSIKILHIHIRNILKRSCLAIPSKN